MALDAMKEHWVNKVAALTKIMQQDKELRSQIRKDGRSGLTPSNRFGCAPQSQENMAKLNKKAERRQKHLKEVILGCEVLVVVVVVVGEIQGSHARTTTI